MAGRIDDDDELTLWREAVDRLLQGGAKPAEALEGANLLLAAHRRKQSHTRLRPPPVPELDAPPAETPKRKLR